MVDLFPYNTFGIHAEARDLIAIRSEQQLVTFLQGNREPLFILGGGSNILLTKNVDAIVLRNEIEGIEILSENEDAAIIKVGGGESWHSFVEWAIARQLGGIENLSLIPGTVGAAPIQNIGAYGAELQDVFHSLQAVDMQSGESVTFSREQCEFGYRESYFKKEGKGRYFISFVSFVLQKKPIINANYGDIRKILDARGITDPNIKDISDAVIEIRRSKLPDPKLLGNAGSFFKNPEISAEDFRLFAQKNPDAPHYVQAQGTVKIPAGWLIEKAGWKGKRIGDAGCHEKQALVLVNYGNATGNEIVDLARQIQKDVLEKFGIALSPEVNWI
jgi:UDP-N-acetylmuramate dehydrogenase